MAYKRKKFTGKCRNCGKKVGAPRGLCWRCYETPEIRNRFAVSRQTHEPTQEEVDALIAQQSANLPSWWDESKAHEDIT